MRREGAARVVLAQDVVAAQVEAVVGVEVAEEDGVDGGGVGVPLQGAERSAAEVEQDPPGAVRRRRRPRPGSSSPRSPVRRRSRSSRSRSASLGCLMRDHRRTGRPSRAPGRGSGGRCVSNSSGAPVVRKRYAGSPPAAHQVGTDEQLVDVLGALLGAADQGDAVADDVGDHAGEQRVVGAAEDQGVDARPRPAGRGSRGRPRAARRRRSRRPRRSRRSAGTPAW